MLCSFHKSTTHSDETCRTLQQQLGNNGSANCANQGSDYPAVLTASDPPPGRNIEEQGISFAAVEVPTKDEPSIEESFWPPVKRLPRSTPAGFSAALEAPPARTLKAQLSRSRKVRSRNWGFGTISLEGLQLSWACLEPFSTPPARDHQLASAGTGDSDPHHWYPGNVGSCFDNGGCAPLRLAHPRQLPL